MGKDLEISNAIQNYIKNLSKPLHPVQIDIISHNESLGDIKRLQISITQCLFLEMITKVSKAKKILEIGTFTGLSALSMSLGLPEDGLLVALDKNKETSTKAQNYFKKAKQDKKIKTIVKPALDTLKDLSKDNSTFDIVFIDADKENNKNYYNQVMSMVKKNGLIIIDNVLWHGEVADVNNNQKYTKIIREFNKYVKADIRTEQIIVPLGDGITICRKI